MTSSLRVVRAGLACLLVLLPLAAQATTLRYDFTFVVTGTSYWHMCHGDGDCDDYEADGDATTFQGSWPSSGPAWMTVELLEDTGGGVFEVALDYSALGLPYISADTWMFDYDPVLKNASFELYNGYDGMFFDIAPGAGLRGSGSVGWEQDWSGVDWASILFEFHDVSVTDLSQVPLPATLPLLVAGAAGLGALGWRKRAA